MEDKNILKLKTKEAVKHLLSKGYNCEEIADKLKKNPEYIRRVRRQIRQEGKSYNY